MSRPPRIEYPGALYLVSAFSQKDHILFASKEQYRFFLHTVEQTIERYGWLCYGYCLLPNCYYLLLETPAPNLSLGMRQINGIYTQYLNRQNSSEGSLFHDRFKSIIVEKEKYLLELCRSLSHMPVEEELVKKPAKWPWSSFHHQMDSESCNTFVQDDWIFSQFAKKTKKGRKRYKQYIAEASQALSPLLFVRSRIFLGCEEFIHSVKELAGSQKHRDSKRPTLETIFSRQASSDKKIRNKQIHLAHRDHGYLIREIAEHLNLHHTTISKIINNP